MTMKADVLKWIHETIRNPEDGKPFLLYPAQVRFIARAFELTDEGRLNFPEMVFSCAKKSGKTALAAMIMLTVIVYLSGPNAEGYAFANDYEQASSRVFAAAVQMVEASPKLASIAKITANKIAFPSLGSSITALASDAAGSAGANPSITCFDEIWGYSTERAQRLWDENPISPARRISCRLTTSYAGYSGESILLENLIKRGLAGSPLGNCLFFRPNSMLAYIATGEDACKAPWQTQTWIEEQRQSMRPNAFLRQIHNMFVSGESSFIPIEWWDECATESGPLWHAPDLDVAIGIDASVKRDCTAIAVTAFDRTANRVRLVWHRIWQPSSDEPLNFESTIENTVANLRDRFNVKTVLYDPYQMQSTSQRLKRDGLPMLEYPQTSGNLTDMGSNLYELLKSRSLVAYRDPDLRLAMQRAIAVEGSRGWKIDKAKASHKIDIVVALAMSALGAVRNIGGQVGEFSWGTGVGFGEITYHNGRRDLPTALDASHNACVGTFFKNGDGEEGIKRIPNPHSVVGFIQT
jgi:phage terminase large subunit-like protein